AYRALRNVCCAHDFVGEPVNLFLLVPRFVSVKLHVQCGGEHLGGKLFGVITSHIVGFAKGMMFTQVTVGASVGRNGQSNRGGRQAVWLARGVLRHNGKRDFTGERYLSPSLRGMSLQLGGKMDDTRTKFWAAMPASRSANSNEVSR